MASPPDLQARWASKLLTVNAAAILPFFVGLCYFYDRAYRLAYFGPFGLDPDAVPRTFQDAIADGFLGIAAHVLWLAVILAAVGVGYVTITWLAGWYATKLATRLGIPDRDGSPPEVLAALGRSSGFRLTLLVAALTFGLAMVCAVALFLVGLPADHAGRADGVALRKSVTSTQAVCARYDLDKGRIVIGRPLAGTAERQFVLGNDGQLHIVKYDDTEGLSQKPVPCQAPPTKAPLAGRPL